MSLLIDFVQNYFIVFIIGFLIIYGIGKWNNNVLKEVPGFKEILLLGHLFYFKSKSPIAGIHVLSYFQSILSGMSLIYQKEGMFKLKAGAHNLVILTSPKTVQVITSNKTELVKGDSYKTVKISLGAGLFTADGGEMWKKQRKIINPSFHNAVVDRDYLPVMNRHAHQLMQRLKVANSKSYVSILEELDHTMFEIILESAMGTLDHFEGNENEHYKSMVKIIDEAFIERSYKPWLKNDTLFSMTERGKQFHKAVQSTRDFVKRVVDTKKLLRKNYGDDTTNYNSDKNVKLKSFLDLLLDEQKKDKNSFSDENILDQVNTFIGAGYTTTAVTTSWAIYLLGLHPEIQEKAFEEVESIFGSDKDRHVTLEDGISMKYLTSIINESNRLYPTIPMIARELQNDISIDGRRIPKNTEIVAYFWAMHRNPEFFPEPEVFNPDRTFPEKAFMPFSDGPRKCIGQSFAMLQVKVFIATILRNFRVKSLDHRDKVIYIPLVTGQPNCEIRMKVTPRKDVDLEENFVKL